MTDALSTVIVATGSCIPGRRVANEDFLGHRLFEDYGKPFGSAAASRPSDPSTPLAHVDAFTAADHCGRSPADAGSRCI